MQVGSFLLQHVLVGRTYAPRHAIAMKSQFTRELIETPARAPAFYTAARERVVRGTHPSQNRTELLVLFGRQKTTLEIDHEVLADYLSFTSQRKTDHDQHDDESRDHHEDVHK